MNPLATEPLDQIRQQFEQTPYPRTPLERSPNDDPYLLYTHNLATAYYLRYQQVINTQDKLILDVGCGTGYTTLVLAAANPGARVVGIDISPGAIDLACKRAAYHNYEHVEFYVLGVEELDQLGLTFDYINCDQVLYLLMNPQQGLDILRSLLHPQGIIRTNLHSHYQRLDVFQAQDLFKFMGLQAVSPQQREIEIVRETMTAMGDQVILKAQTWQQSYNQDDESVLSNFLLVGDKGYTIPETATMLEAAGLELFSMVDWRQWQVRDLFEEPDNLPLYLSFAIANLTLTQQLEMYELLHPIHRLLDFWCGHAEEIPEKIAVAEWEVEDWHKAKVYLHPQLLTEAAREEAIAQIKLSQTFLISWHLPLTGKPYLLDPKITSCLLPLWNGRQNFLDLLARWQSLYSLDPVTLAPAIVEQAQEILINALTELESLGYVMLSQSASHL